MDRAYLSEDKEGGIMALGSDVPNVPRTQLNVFTDQEFQKQKSRLVYQAWTANVLAAASE